MKIPRGIRNHNPGNIRESPFDRTQWVGERATDDDPAFEEFQAPEFGLRALARVLRTYSRRYGRRSVRELIGRWAPPNENDTLNYVRQVCLHLGVEPDAVLDLGDADTLADLMEAIIRHENGQQPYSRELILRGISLESGE